MIIEEFNELVSREKAAWEKLNDANLDVRVAERGGDDIEIKNAKRSEVDLNAEWYNLRTKINGVKGSVFKTAGFSDQVIEKYIK